MKRVIGFFSVACAAAALLALLFAFLFPVFTSVTTDGKTVSTDEVIANTSALNRESAVENGISEPPEESLPPVLEKYSFIWMTDTQYYSKYYPEIQTKMIDWTLENIESLNIKALFHTGDIIHNYDDADQWERAKTEYSRLSGKLNHMLLAGNHDVGFSAVDYEPYFTSIGDGGKVVPEGNGGIYDNGKGQYLLFSTETNKFIFIGFAWNLSVGMMDWANGLLETYSDRIAVILTHSYLNTDGTLTANGLRLYEQVVSVSPNVQIVLCGHNHSAIRVENEFDDDGDGKTDRVVTQILADYQDEEKGGMGYLRIITVDEETQIIEIQTYSPYLDDYGYYDDSVDEFTIDIGQKGQNSERNN